MPEAQIEQAPVFTDEHPEFPMLVYNHETRQSKPAADKEAKDKLAKDGFVEEPLPAEEPDALTPEDVKQLEALLHKAAKALAKLGELSEKHKASGEKREASGGEKREASGPSAAPPSAAPPSAEARKKG